MEFGYLVQKYKDWFDSKVFYYWKTNSAAGNVLKNSRRNCTKG